MRQGYTCSHCGALYMPFALPPHDCAGVRADLADAARATPDAQPGADARGRRALMVGDTVEWTEKVGVERGGAIRHGSKRGVVSRLVDGGKSVLVRTGNTLVELNMARVKRVAGSEMVSRKDAKAAKREGVRG